MKYVQLSKSSGSSTPVENYIDSFLRSQHPHRKGAVCPFIGLAIDEGKVRIASSGVNVPSDLNAFVKEIVNCHIFQNKSDIVTIVSFEHGVSLRKLKNAVNKARTVASTDGWMIGAFGPTEMTPSLNNSDYYPFRSPSVMLVIREMTIHDYQFFENAGSFFKRSPKIAMYQGFVKRFGNAEHPQTIEKVGQAKNEIKRLHFSIANIFSRRK